MIDKIRKILHAHWMHLIKEHQRQSFFYCVTGLRWGPLIGEMAYAISHAEINDYHLCFIVDTNSSHWVTFNSLKISCSYSAIDIGTLTKELSITPEEEHLLASPAENTNMLENIINDNKGLFRHTQWTQARYIYYPFATLLKVLIHSSEYVHYQHSTGTWNEAIFNERVFSTFHQENTKPSGQQLFTFEQKRWDAIIHEQYPSLYTAIRDEHPPEELLVISTRNVPFGWDQTRNSCTNSIKEIFKSALEHGIKCIFLAGQTPSREIKDSIATNWKGKLFDVTQPCYLSYEPNYEQKLKIALELFVLSGVKYQIHSSNGFIFIPYLLGSTLMMYDANIVTPSGPEAILVPKHTQFLSRLVQGNTKRNKGQSLLDGHRIEPPKGTCGTALTNLLSIKSKNDFEILRSKARFTPELHLYERRNMYCSPDAFPGNNEEKSGFKEYTARGIIQLNRDITARSC